MVIFWTILAIAALVVIFSIAIGWKAWKAKGELKGKDKRDAYILTVFLFAYIAAMVRMMFYYEATVTGQPIDLSDLWFPPIWIVVFVPIWFAASKKGKKKPTEKERKLTVAAVAIGVIALIAGVLAALMLM
jgi:hypothetical protein